MWCMSVCAVYTLAFDRLDDFITPLLCQQEEVEREEHAPSPPVVPLHGCEEGPQ